MSVNLNELAKEITLKEGLKESISIAQVKEIIKIFGNRWQSMTFDGVVEEVNTIIKKSKKK